jgi:hypothetical protein
MRLPQNWSQIRPILATKGTLLYLPSDLPGHRHGEEHRGTHNPLPTFFQESRLVFWEKKKVRSQIYIKKTFEFSPFTSYQTTSFFIPNRVQELWYSNMGAIQVPRKTVHKNNDNCTCIYKPKHINRKEQSVTSKNHNTRKRTKMSA